MTGMRVIKVTELVFDIAEPSTAAALMMAIVAGLILCLGLFFGWLALSIGNPSVELSETTLRINIPLYGRSISRKEIVAEKARIVDLNDETSLGPRFRTNGIGLPGYRIGWFRLRNGDKALAALTGVEQVLYVPTTRDYSILVSVVEPGALLQALQTGNESENR